MTPGGWPFSVAGLAACMACMAAAPVSTPANAATQSTGQAVVSFSPNSPAPIDASPEAQAFFLAVRPKPGTRPALSPDPTDPAQRAWFLQVRQGVEQALDTTAQRTRTPFARVDTTMDGVSVTWLTSPDTTRRGRVILYLHPGSFIYGSGHGWSVAMLGLANATGMRILAVNYRLAPETPFPGGMDDVKTVYRWLLQRGYAPEHIVVMGESAGGGLALSALLSLRDEGVPMPAALVALSPWADLTRTGDTEETLAPHSSLCWETDLAAAAKAYTAGQDPHNPLISPVYAHYTGMPPMLLYAGTREILLSDAIRVNHQALADGVAATLDIWEGMFHMFPHMGLPESREALDKVADYILSHVK